jgi:hypothetical protein
MARHKEKDDEAGGEGLGILATRKRLWRDADGNIVNARRPSYTQDGAKRRQITRPERKGSNASTVDNKKLAHGGSVIPAAPSPMSRAGSTASSTIIVDTSVSGKSEDEFEPQRTEDSWLGLSALPSPPTSSSSLQSSGSQSPIAELEEELDTLYEDTWPLTHNGLSTIINNSPILGRTSEYPPSPSWGPQPFQTFMGAMGELPYDDIFKPETGLYDWQQWNSQVLMSRCREEKVEPQFGERRATYPESGFRRAFGLGTC